MFIPTGLWECQSKMISKETSLSPTKHCGILFLSTVMILAHHHTLGIPCECFRFFPYPAALWKWGYWEDLAGSQRFFLSCRNHLAHQSQPNQLGFEKWCRMWFGMPLFTPANLETVETRLIFFLQVFPHLPFFGQNMQPEDDYFFWRQIGHSLIFWKMLWITEMYFFLLAIASNS